MQYGPRRVWIAEWGLPLAVTHPTPASLAFLMATCMAKLPTTGPSRLRPSTLAVAARSVAITGSESLAVVPERMSFTYIAIQWTYDRERLYTHTGYVNDPVINSNLFDAHLLFVIFCFASLRDWVVMIVLLRRFWHPALFIIYIQNQSNISVLEETSMMYTPRRVFSTGVYL